MGELNLNLAAEAATETAEAVAQAVESAVPATTKNGVTIPVGGAIALGVTSFAGAATLAYIGRKKAAAAIHDFHEYRKLKKKGVLATTEATEKSADGEVKPVEAEVVQTDEPSSSEQE